MSLNQKYTWNQFLRDHPELKKKGVKRTSSEGKKAFESAFKTKMKTYLTERMEKVNDMKKRASDEKKALTQKVISFQKAKDFSKTKIYQLKAGRQDAWLGRLDKQAARIKNLQKSF